MASEPPPKSSDTENDWPATSASPAAARIVVFTRAGSSPANQQAKSMK